MSLNIIGCTSEWCANGEGAFWVIIEISILTVAEKQNDTNHEFEHHDESSKNVSASWTDFTTWDKQEQDGTDEDSSSCGKQEYSFTGEFIRVDLVEIASEVEVVANIVPPFETHDTN